MTVQYFWLGSTGPFKYDDAERVNDKGLLFDAGTAPFQAPIVTTGQLTVKTVASNDDDVMRKGDVVDGVIGPAVSAIGGIAGWVDITGDELASSNAKVDIAGSVFLPNGQALQVNSTQVVGSQQSAEADVAAVSAITVSTGTDTIGIAGTNTSLSTLVGEINAIKTKLNNLLAKLRTHGLIDT